MEDIVIAEESVLLFVNAMNAWESKAYLFFRQEHGKYISEESRSLLHGESRESLDKQYYEALASYCTKRERKYGGHPTSCGKPTRFSGITKESIVDRIQPNKNRIEIVIDSKVGFKNTYKFVLFKKDNFWSIDSLKIHLSGKWENDYL